MEPNGPVGYQKKVSTQNNTDKIAQHLCLNDRGVWVSFAKWSLYSHCCCCCWCCCCCYHPSPVGPVVDSSSSLFVQQCLIDAIMFIFIQKDNAGARVRRVVCNGRPRSAREERLGGLGSNFEAGWRHAWHDNQSHNLKSGKAFWELKSNWYICLIVISYIKQM